ncbi:MAG: peptidylprolyl isomerase [Pseudomonadota bacterium]
MAIEKNSVVTLEYTLQDDKGNTIDSTDGRDSFSYIHGTNTLFPAFEAKLEGHNSGEQLKFTLSPEQAYGVRDERLMKTVPRERFNTGDEIKVGMSFKTGKDDDEVEVIVVAADDKEVTIDANPPLAGVTLSFDVVITNVRDAGSEELETGKVTSIDEIYSQ